MSRPSKKQEVVSFLPELEKWVRLNDLYGGSPFTQKVPKTQLSQEELNRVNRMMKGDDVTAPSISPKKKPKSSKR